MQNLKVVIVSLLVAVPVFVLGSFLELGLDVDALQNASYWRSHIYFFLSYGLVSWLSYQLVTGSGEKSSGTATGKESGTVKWFSSSKGYGFITRDQGDDVFVHYRSIEGRGHRALYEGQKVSFVVTDGDKGLQAEDVEVISGGPPKKSKRRKRS